MDHFDDHRFETFKMPNSGCHSRNSSVSLSVSASIKSTNSLELAPSKRNSHHRRRSSVSTRHESAELMGVSIAELTPSPSRDSFNIGEKDSIRQKALWALEGKPDASYIKVEIPELSTAEIDTQLMFDFPTRPSFPPGVGAAFGTGMPNKRDSFKLLGGALASEDRLGTLVEEEEEEDSDLEAPLSTPLSGLHEPATPISPETSSPLQVITISHRTRPANLTLRPLSLTPESLNIGLPTPGSAPNSSNHRSGLKSLSLLANSADDAVHDGTSPHPRRPMLNLQISSDSLASTVTCVSATTPSSASEDGKQDKGSRRSSISYKRSQPSIMNGLPTPEMTPTFPERRYSGNSAGSLSSRSSLSSNLDFGASSDNDDSVPSVPPFSKPSKHRALSASEQHFLFKSHNALLARIQDLEKALSVRRREPNGFQAGSIDAGSQRPLSVNSDVSSSPGEPSDEMLRLVADLKAERDELKRDVDGWRTRVSDLEKQISVFTNRVDNERRDAWVARSRVGLLEVEKGSLLKEMEEKESLIDELSKLVASLEEQKRVLLEENEQLTAQTGKLKEEKAEVEKDVERWRQECELLKDESSLATPTPLAARSFESSKRSFVLGAVQKRGHSQADAGSDLSEEDDGLVNYEDEEEGDMAFHGSSSSLDSLDGLPHSTSELQAGFQFPRTHQSQSSLSKTWTFPKKDAQPAPALEESKSIDRFFECLSSSSGGSPADSPLSSDSYSYDRGMDLFASALRSVNDDDIPFFLPHGVGSNASPSQSSQTLASVTEEEEEEEASDRYTAVEDDQNMFGEVGGIKITFTPPQDEPPVFFKPEPIVEKPSPEEKDEGDKMRSFSFGRPSTQASPMITPPKSVPRATAIPRYRPSSPETVVTPPKLNSPRFGTPTSSPSTTFVTPPTKRGGITPSFIPQPVTPPSPQRSSYQSTAAPRISLIRQPQRRPLQAANGVVSQAQISSNGSASKPQPSINSGPLATPTSLKRPVVRKSHPST